VAAGFTALGGQVALNGGIQHNYQGGIDRLTDHPGLTPVAEASAPDGDGFLVRPMVFGSEIGKLDELVTQECFGPVTVLVSYSDEAELIEALTNLPGSLTATLHVAQSTEDDVTTLVDALRPRAGRLLFNGFPTGVAVAWAQHHGGPWPATNTLHTSVGITSIRRFLRPVAWQDAPQQVLPVELRDGDASVPRRVDGTLVL
jgi:NADP-dependent aldehyde dehydrogenase